MKKTVGIALGLACLLLAACTPNMETKVEFSEPADLEVYSIHELEVRSEVDLKAFEKFALTQIAPIYNNMKGQKFYLLKGDRGVRTNKYAILLTFESVEDRNRIYPPTGEFVGDFGSDETWDRFNSMLIQGIGRIHTDYVKVIH